MKLIVADTTPAVSEFNPTTDMQIERLLDGVSPLANQQPTGVGEANQIQVSFGAAQLGPTDPVQLLADGSLVINQAGTYRLKVSFVAGRTGGAGTSALRFRALINGVQAGLTVGFDIQNSNVAIPYADEAWLTVPAGLTFTYEILRDALGNDSGGIFAQVIDPGTAASWNDAPCCAIRVERWVGV